MIKDIAHIALNPLDMDKTVAYFDNVFGWKKVFELHKDNGDPWIVYLKICKGHFLELFYDGKNDRDYAFDFKKTGYNHLCVTVGNIRKTLQEIYEKVVYENLSLNEIAEAEGVSKQAVHDLVRRCTAILRGYEEKLGMIRRFGKIRKAAARLRNLASLEEVPDPVAFLVMEIAEEICTDLET